MILLKNSDWKYLYSVCFLFDGFGVGWGKDGGDVGGGIEYHTIINKANEPNRAVRSCNIILAHKNE